ncbi:MAG TPA: hypothetical protein VM406_03710, partial [Noviherbaspirillum sp.]|nr:hypothetical protein [Noviherbaspirillum sp.]
YVLNADRPTIREAPGFDMARWPDLGDPHWRATVDGYWARRTGHAVGLHNDPLSAPAATTGTGQGSGAARGGAPPPERAR